MDDPVSSLLERAERYAQASGLALSTVSLKIMRDGKRLSVLKQGDVSITHRRLNEATARLAELERTLRAPAEAAP